MCTAKTAKELSEVSHRYYSVTNFNVSSDRIVEDEPEIPGLVLQGYLDGKPVYCSMMG